MQKRDVEHLLHATAVKKMSGVFRRWERCHVERWSQRDLSVHFGLLQRVWECGHALQLGCVVGERDRAVLVALQLKQTNRNRSAFGSVIGFQICSRQGLGVSEL